MSRNSHPSAVANKTTQLFRKQGGTKTKWTNLQHVLVVQPTAVSENYSSSWMLIILSQAKQQNVFQVTFFVSN